MSSVALNGFFEGVEAQSELAADESRMYVATVKLMVPATQLATIMKLVEKNGTINLVGTLKGNDTIEVSA